MAVGGNKRRLRVGYGEQSGPAAGMAAGRAAGMVKGAAAGIGGCWHGCRPSRQRATRRARAAAGRRRSCGKPERGLMLVALEVDARVHGAEHLLGGGRDGAVAEGLERQDGERLLDLDADLVIVCA
eukprot:scaffold33595_cov50-Phaeocystis_antarctica.AAC.4